MRPIATLQAERYGIDHVIIWDDGQQLIAYAYDHGKTMKTRPLEAHTVNQAVGETLAAFQIPEAQVSRIIEPDHPKRAMTLPKRWA